MTKRTTERAQRHLQRRGKSAQSWASFFPHFYVSLNVLSDVFFHFWLCDATFFSKKKRLARDMLNVTKRKKIRHPIFDHTLPEESLFWSTFLGHSGKEKSFKKLS